MHVRLLSGLLLLLVSSLALQAGSAEILKVLPFYLDLEGRHSLSPSLYERDAYQAYLRLHPDKRSALRFDVNWKAKHLGSEKPLLRIELRSSGGNAAKPLVLEKSVRPPRFFSGWSSLLLEGDAYRNFGQVLAWRVTLWLGEDLLAEQKSFLW
jgi:hypothetical protein